MAIIRVTFTEVTTGKRHEYVHPKMSKKDFYVTILDCLCNKRPALVLYDMTIPLNVLQQCFISCEEISSSDD